MAAPGGSPERSIPGHLSHSEWRHSAAPSLWESTTLVTVSGLILANCFLFGEMYLSFSVIVAEDVQLRPTVAAGTRAGQGSAGYRNKGSGSSRGSEEESRWAG